MQFGDSSKHVDRGGAIRKSEDGGATTQSSARFALTAVNQWAIAISHRGTRSALHLLGLLALFRQSEPPLLPRRARNGERRKVRGEPWARPVGSLSFSNPLHVVLTFLRLQKTQSARSQPSFCQAASSSSSRINGISSISLGQPVIDTVPFLFPCHDLRLAAPSSRADILVAYPPLSTEPSRAPRRCRLSSTGPGTAPRDPLEQDIWTPPHALSSHPPSSHLAR